MIIHFISPQAYKNWLKNHKEEKDLPKIGLSHDQLFYLSFAHVMNASPVSFSFSVSSTLLQIVFLNIQSPSPHSQNWDWLVFLWDSESDLETKIHIYSP